MNKIKGKLTVKQTKGGYGLFLFLKGKLSASNFANHTKSEQDWELENRRLSRNAL